MVGSSPASALTPNTPPRVGAPIGGRAPLDSTVGEDGAAEAMVPGGGPAETACSGVGTEGALTGAVAGEAAGGGGRGAVPSGSMASVTASSSALTSSAQSA